MDALETGPGKKEGLKETMKQARKITWKRA